MGCVQKKPNASVAVPPAPVLVLSQRPRVSHLSANDKDYNEYMHRYPGIYLMAEENPGNPQLGDRLMKVV